MSLMTCSVLADAVVLSTRMEPRIHGAEVIEASYTHHSRSIISVYVTGRPGTHIRELAFIDVPGGIPMKDYAFIESLSLYQFGVQKAVTDASGAVAAFRMKKSNNPTGHGPIVIPNSGITELEVRMRFKKGFDALSTGERLQWHISTGLSRAFDENGQRVPVLLGNPIASRRLIVRKSDITVRPVEKRVGPNAYLINGQNRLTQFSVSAGDNGPIAWKGIKFFVMGRFNHNLLTTTSCAQGGFGIVKPDDNEHGFVDSEDSLCVGGFALYDKETGKHVQEGEYRIHLDWYDPEERQRPSYGEVAIVLNDGFQEEISAGSDKVYVLGFTVYEDQTSLLDIFMDRKDDRRVNYLRSTNADGVDGVHDNAIHMTIGASDNPAHAPCMLIWSDMSGGNQHSAKNQVLDRRAWDWTNEYPVTFSLGGFVRRTNLQWIYTSTTQRTL